MKSSDILKEIKRIAKEVLPEMKPRKIPTGIC